MGYIHYFQWQEHVPIYTPFYNPSIVPLLQGSLELWRKKQADES